MFRKLSVLLIVCTLVAVAALPLIAQNATPDPNSQVVVVGPVDLTHGGIMVNNYIIAPASAFQPSILHQGDEVIIIGNLLPDGITIQATSFEFFEPTPEITPEPTQEVTVEPTEEMTVEPTEEVTTEPTQEVTVEPTTEVTVEPTVEVTSEPTPMPGCTQLNQPVAQRLADAFGVSYAEIINWHCQGFGFGEIARAYLLADATGNAPSTYFAERLAGEGWGEIVKQTGVHPSDLAPGQVIRHHAASTEESPNDNHPGNGQGNSGSHGNDGGNGNGNGNGGGSGNGNGHGNGNGNSGGNGNGNGHGSGHP